MCLTITHELAVNAVEQFGTGATGLVSQSDGKTHGCTGYSVPVLAASDSDGGLSD